MLRYARRNTSEHGKTRRLTRACECLSVREDRLRWGRPLQRATPITKPKERPQTVTKKTIAWYSYREYLESSQWKWIRDVVMRRDGFKCCFCGAPAVDAHHVEYPWPWHNDSPDNVIALCRACHIRAHEQEQRASTDMIGQLELDLEIIVPGVRSPDLA